MGREARVGGRGLAINVLNRRAAEEMEKIVLSQFADDGFHHPSTGISGWKNQQTGRAFSTGRGPFECWGISGARQAVLDKGERGRRIRRFG
jgi:hypothetical protein